MSTPLIELYLTCEQAAAELDVCVPAVQSLCRSRKLRHIRHGRRYLFRKEDLILYLESNAVEAKPATSKVALKHL